MKIELASLKTPLGGARLAVVDGALCALTMEGGWDAVSRRLDDRFPHAERSTARDPTGVCSALRSYFEGDLRALDALEVSPAGTPFQTAVWRALRRVQVGTTISYAGLAKMARRPSAIRAVGTAMAMNPIWIVQPCHRVLRSDGSLGGYAGGLDAKRWLLEHEEPVA